MRRGIVALGAMTLSACASMRGNGQSASACAPVTGALASGVSLAPLAGRFVITMTATEGPQRGQSVSGYLTLRAAPAGTSGPAAGARTAFIGVTDVRLETVGGLRLGDTGSEDPRAPGIAIYETRPATGGPTVTARIGSETTAAPTPGMQPIEGSVMALFIRNVTSGGFAGGWSAAIGGRSMDGRAGYFCAVKVE